MSIPIKDSYLTEKSIELFNDDDPCIIHKSYIIKGYTDQILDLFKEHNTATLNAGDHLDILNNIDFADIEQIILELKE
jgi:hypothetical protein